MHDRRLGYRLGTAMCAIAWRRPGIDIYGDVTLDLPTKPHWRPLNDLACGLSDVMSSVWQNELELLP